MKFIIFIFLLFLTQSQYFTKHHKKIPLYLLGDYIGQFPYQQILETKYQGYNEFPQSIEPISYLKFYYNWLVHQPLGDGATAQVFLVQDLETTEFKVVKKYAQSSNFDIQNFIMKQIGINVNWTICPETNQTIAIYEQFPTSRNLSDLSLPQRQVKIIMFKVIVQLIKAHQKGIIHTDIKPANVLIDTKKLHRKYETQKIHLQIIDWNLSQLFYKGKKLDWFTGTRKYMAPQMIIGSVYYTPAIDVWSLGILMFRMITGKHILRSEDQIKHLIEIFGINRFKKFYQKINPQRDEDTIEQYRKAEKVKMIGFSRLKQYNLTQQQINFLQTILVLQPELRPTCKELLNDPYFADVINFKQPRYYKNKKKAEQKQKRKKDEIQNPQSK